MLVGKYVRAAVAVVLGGVTCGGAVGIAGSTVSAAESTCGTATYEVRAGDGWFAIARRVAVEVDDLLAANGASVDDLLVAGDDLCLPSGADLVAACAGATYEVRAGDGWFAIAQRHGVDTSELLAVNGADLTRAMHPGTTLCLPSGADAPADAPTASEESRAASGGSTSDYTVASGDSWSWIAERAEVSMGRLLAANDASATDVLRPGDEIALPAGAQTPAPSQTASAASVQLAALPSQGPCWYSDTWLAPRGNGRTHRGVDLFTLRSQYVYAVADGRLTSRSWEQPGSRSGNAWMLTGADGNQYFYAHMSDFAPDLSVGSWVEAGQIIGWVGNTGNSSADHLHFEIRPGGGTSVNPYPILRAAGGCNQGAPYTQPGGWNPDRVG